MVMPRKNARALLLLLGMGEKKRMKYLNAMSSTFYLRRSVQLCTKIQEFPIVYFFQVF
jgi:hypothetical protein